MNARLHLKPSVALLRPTTAWLLPGNDPARWLDELVRCGWAEAGTRLFVVPKSAADRTALGLLVVPEASLSPRHAPAGLACGLAAPEIFLPVDAELVPAVDPAELTALAAWPVVLLHPSVGPIGFEASAMLRVWHLLERPEERAADWNGARWSEPGPAPFRGVVLRTPPPVAEVFGEESRDIGSQASEKLPPPPGEGPMKRLTEAASDAASEALRKLGWNAAEWIRRATDRVPHTASRRTWVHGLEDWTQKWLFSGSSVDQARRNREMDRLLDLLERDPEAGLRHAMPLNGFSHRGRAAVTNQLGEHSLDFDPSNLGGRPGDSWQVSGEVLQKLAERYRELADRELKLGRHRRAAYIFAELLGDLSSAANALRQGRYFREAAVLYEERLSNAVLAAQCLAEGGFLTEALERYEKLQRFEEIAAIWERLGDTPRAQTAWRSCVTLQVTTGEILAAARVLEERLNAVDEAIALLTEAGWNRDTNTVWPPLFGLLGRHGRHDLARDWVSILRRLGAAPERLEPIAETMLQQSKEYPDRDIARLAGEAARSLAAHGLSEREIEEKRADRLGRILVQLDPEDRLLERDVLRFCASFKRPAPRKIPPSEPPKGEVWTLKKALVRSFRLGERAEWLRVRADAGGLFAAANAGGTFTVLRGTWDGASQTVKLADRALRPREPVVLEKVSPGRLIVGVVGSSPLAERRFPALAGSFDESCVVSSPAWFSGASYPLAVGESVVWDIRVAANNAVLSGRDLEGRLVSTRDVTRELIWEGARTEATRLCLVTSGNQPMVAQGNRLLLFRRSDDHVAVRLSGQVRALVPTLPHTRVGAAVLLERGAVVHWMDVPSPIEIDEETPWESGTWLPGGFLVLCAAKRGLVCEVDTNGARNVRRFVWAGEPILAVTPGPHRDQFAIVTQRGDVALYWARMG